MPTLQVFSTSGTGTRDILVPGRSAWKPYGGVIIRNNVGMRQESDWAAIKAAIAAGNVVIALSGYEADVLPTFIEGKIACGGNVRFDARKKLTWRLVEEDGYCQIETFDHVCVHCDEQFPSSFALGGHMQQKHRGIVQRGIEADS